MPGEFELYTDKAGNYRFQLKAASGEVIESKSGADNGMWIEPPSWQQSRAVPVCIAPGEHGHRYAFGPGGVNKLSDDQRTERREVIENNKAWRAAEPVRRAFVRDLRALTKPPAPALATPSPKPGPTPPGSGGPGPPPRCRPTCSARTHTHTHRHTSGADWAAHARDTQLPLALMAQVAADREADMDVEVWRYARPAAVRWLQFLVEVGYPPSAIEQQVIDQAATHGAELVQTTAITTPVAGPEGGQDHLTTPNGGGQRGPAPLRCGRTGQADRGFPTRCVPSEPAASRGREA
jgi:ParB family chromosome partitioning protein